MIDLVKSNLRGQFGASLKMLELCIDRCEPKNWTANVGSVAFWRVAYHTLFFTDFYLSPKMEDYKPQPWQVRGVCLFSRPDWWPAEKQMPNIDPYDQVQMKSYLDFCLKLSADIIDAETESTFTGPSGFEWLPFPRFGAHLYNLRHIQHHTGQLSAALIRLQGKGAGWVRAWPE